ncbi:MAG TPA: TaqI-like C-terminal specificity domain-containing protein [Bacteroidales bacterium]|jgi:type I restriction-modification system DNA methylase subunit|nr:MAG: Type IIS restriction enzyme Eco57I [Bacteroidetes bacterium ADurb.Bin145]HQK68267.1 TaqI-like C-terminal specificity domain-containing protein [Bacteroidales bacterium]
MVDKLTAHKNISNLVTRFENQYDSYSNVNYNETQTRKDFIDPFFKALGWDIDNEAGYAEAYREVIQEDKVKISGATKAPDYSFRLVGGKRLFFVEAKKPSISVKDDIHPAYQVRRYGCSAKHPISIVTDFEEFGVYDCTKKPDPNDKPAVARVKYLTYRDYLKEFDFIWETFSKEQVLKGSFDKFIQSDTNKKGTTTVDKEFLESLDRWRTYLAVNISWNNKNLDEDEINFAVQQTIDRIIFLRIAEDRSVEPYGNLKQALSHRDFYLNLFDQFRRADEKYNSGLFDFKKDKISENLVIENKVIKTLLNELYYPECPYEFSVLPVEILGSAYEQFLGKIIRITPAHHAKIEEKPEVRKAGGVYYTPQYIVDYIVKNTVGKLIEGKTPKEISKIKIVDPACGSGSFLIGAYQFLLDWHKNYYSNYGRTSKGKKDNPLTPEGQLTTAEKKRILLNNIYGVDIDINAVEVTKLSLLIKCLEGETEASIQQQFRLWNERVLPTLENNIKSGNSLIDIDFYDDQLDFGEEKKIKPFSWQKGFQDVFRQGGFDVLIGNPPYGALFDEVQKQYFVSHYKTVEGRYDNFELFIEKGTNLLSKHGLLGYIVPSPFLTNLYSRKLRSYIITSCRLKEIVCFTMPVFYDPTVHTCIILLSSTYKKGNSIIIKNNIDSIEKLISEDAILLDQDEIKTNPNFVIDVFINKSAKDLINKLKSKSKPLGELCFIRQCIKTGDDEKFVLNSKTALAEPWKLSLRGKSISRYSTKERDLYLKYGDWLARNWKNKSFYETHKIAIRETGKRITATIDLENRYFLSSIYAIYYKQIELNNEGDLKFLLGIINSDLANYFMKIIALNLTEGAFTKVRTNQLARLPIVILNEEKDISLKNEIGKLVDILLKLNEELLNVNLESQKQLLLNKSDYCEKKINDIVYQLYGLTSEEIKIVEHSTEFTGTKKNT